MWFYIHRDCVWCCCRPDFLTSGKAKNYHRLEEQVCLGCPLLFLSHIVLEVHSKTRLQPAVLILRHPFKFHKAFRLWCGCLGRVRYGFQWKSIKPGLCVPCNDGSFTESHSGSENSTTETYDCEDAFRLSCQWRRYEQSHLLFKERRYCTGLYRSGRQRCFVCGKGQCGRIYVFPHVGQQGVRLSRDRGRSNRRFLQRLVQIRWNP